MTENELTAQDMQGIAEALEGCEGDLDDAPAVAAEVATRAAAPMGVHHEVKSGETLSGIAQMYGTVSWQEIAAANSIANPSLIHPGQRLLIPHTMPQEHTVHRGESVWAIAREYGVSPTDIVKHNSIPNPSLIVTGQTLVIPGRWVRVEGDAPPPPSPKPKRPEWIDLRGKLAVNPRRGYWRNRTAQIRYVVIHHTTANPAESAAWVTPQALARWIIQPEPGGRNWLSHPYHFHIMPDGKINYCNDVKYLTWHAGNPNNISVGVAMGGGFIGSRKPPQPQMEACARLVAWLAHDLKLPLTAIYGHKNTPGGTSTACPGDEFLTGITWRNEFMALVRTAFNQYG